MKYTSFDEFKFRSKVDDALQKVKTILDVNRNPRYAEHQDHSYEDKYALTEMLVNTALSAQANILQRMGLTEEKLVQLRNIVLQDSRSVTLRFEAEDTCSFLKERSVQVVHSEGGVVVETSKSSSGVFGRQSIKSVGHKHKITTTVKEFHWKVGVRYRIFCHGGNDPSRDAIDLQSRSSSETIITTGSKQAPFSSRTSHPPISCSLTWLLQNIKRNEKVFSCNFKIDRSKDSCRTPRRNDDINNALKFFLDLRHWSQQSGLHVTRRIERQILGTHSPVTEQATNRTDKVESIRDKDVFVPVLPLFDSPQDLPGTATRQEQPRSMLLLEGSSTVTGASPLISVGDLDKFLNEQCRSIDTKVEQLSQVFPSHDVGKLLSIAEATLMLLFHSTSTLVDVLDQGIGYVEDMLRKQLIGAIGKEVQAQDFDDFMRFHSKKLFSTAYSPKPFCFAIRRPDHYPDGMLTIEKAQGSGETKLEPIETMVRTIPNDDPVSIPLSAAATAQMCGPKYLHGWMMHRFESSPKSDYVVAARARQFSSFVLMVGSMSSADSFNPKDAVIIQNKDEVLIPLLLKEIPSAKEFKDAIASLSPEQQRFAKAFRTMRLESSVFGLCVVQLKPQLEALLNLPNDSLTKEIRLTQGLLSLFIEYQIPSDLLSFDGPKDCGRENKVKQVKKHVESVMGVIREAKQEQVVDIEQRAEMNVATQFCDDDHFLRPPAPIVSMRAVPIVRVGTAGAPLEGTRKRSSRARRSCQMEPVERASLQSVRAPVKSELDRSIGRARTKQATATAAVSCTDLAPTTEPTHISEPTTSLSTDDAVQVDFTAVPKQLDAKFGQHDTDGALRATIVETGDGWTRKRSANLLSKVGTSTLNGDTVRSEKNKAFDLLDALSRSGTLPIACAELHVIVAVTHCFENDVVGSVVQDNVNPIEKVEKSSLMIASTIHGVETPQLLRRAEDAQRLSGMFPAIMAVEGGDV